MMGLETERLILRPWGEEVGYWIGVPFWGQGLIPEAVGEVLTEHVTRLTREEYEMRT